jgi:hypothetical protein
MRGFRQSRYNVPAQSDATARQRAIPASNESGGQQSGGKQSIFVPRSSVPEGAPVLPSVWAMKRKRRIGTRDVYKWKSRLNVDGSKQVAGPDYRQTYAPVASWSSI